MNTYSCTPGTVTPIVTAADFENVKRTYAGRLVVVKAGAGWCAPCRMYKGPYEALARQYTNHIFLEFSVDNPHSDLQDTLKVQNLPCTMFFLNGREVDRCIGLNLEKVTSCCSQY